MGVKDYNLLGGTKMKKKRMAALALCFMLVLATVLPNVSMIVKAESVSGPIKLKFNASDLANVTMQYKLGEGTYTEVNAATADGGGAVWIGSISDNTNVTIKAEPKAGYEETFDSIKVAEGEGDNPPAFNGNWNRETNVYTFPATVPGGETERIYSVHVVTKSGPPTPPPGGEDENPNPNWEDQFNQYLGSGLNFISQWVGNSEGEITYEFSNDLDALKNASRTATPTDTLTKSNVKPITDFLTNESNTQEQKNEYTKTKIFGINPTASYVLITTGKDLGGNHMGFEMYEFNSSRGIYERKDNLTDQIQFYDYQTNTWMTFKDASDNLNYRWEDYLKKSEVPGLIIKLDGLDLEHKALRANLPFDSRKNLGWWNAKYKGEVEAAGDRVSDDSWVENGTFDLVSVKGEDGKVYYSNENNWTPAADVDDDLIVVVSRAGYDHADIEHRELRPGYNGPHGNYTAEQMAEAGEKASGDCLIPENAIVTIKAVPDPGYQILSAELNGMPLTPDAGTQGMYSFKMTSNTHITGIFEKTKDVVNVGGAQAVESAKIMGANEILEAGNIALTVTDDTDYNAANALAVVAGEKIASLDVDIDQVIAKAGTLTQEQQQKVKDGTLAVSSENFWKNDLTELNRPVEITLDLNGVTVGEGESISLVRDHNGSCEEIPVTVTTNDGKTNISFSSDKFSTYTFVKTRAQNNTHTHALTLVNAVDATCTTAGNSAYYKCECGKFYSDAEARTEIVENSWVIPAKGHSASEKKITPATTKKDGSIVIECTSCGEELSKTVIKKAVVIVNETVAYTGKAIKPVKIVSSDGKAIASSNYTITYKNNIKPGKATATIKFKGNYSGKTTVSFTIVKKSLIPAKVSGLKVAGAKKSLKVSWKSVKKLADGYEIQYSTDKNFISSVKTVKVNKAKTTSTTISKLKAKTGYYVRIRAYNKDGNKYIYSDWTNVKKAVKTK